MLKALAVVVLVVFSPLVVAYRLNKVWRQACEAQWRANAHAKRGCIYHPEDFEFL